MLIPAMLPAQTIEGGAEYYYERHTAQEREASAMPFIRESDVVWEQTVWRTIDFREKFNHFFYFPIEREGFAGRRNFAYLIWDAVVSGDIPEIYSDDELKIPLDRELFLAQFQKPDTIVLEIVDDDENYEYKTVLVPKEFNSEEMLQLRIKEAWYIDKQVTEQNVRILSLCLTKEHYKEHDGDYDYLGTVELFWIPMLSPHVRRLLVRNEATWQQNIAHQPTWEYIFVNRMFNSFITRISNVYNRTILDYLTGQEAIWESERIESELLDISQDMWEY
ncbi:MAG: gliding motility protein GldN [Bacteroidales bacterium]|nr:gliding motility protein GldN [Bacteroidales bacterium]